MASATRSRTKERKPGSNVLAAKRSQSPKQRRRSCTLPSFWDNLSRIPLCKRALRELDRRCRQHRPPLREVKHRYAGSRVDLKRFARHGGPDLSHIIGVSRALDILSDTSLTSRKQYPQPDTNMPMFQPAQSPGRIGSRMHWALQLSSSNQKRKTTIKTSPYDPAFACHLLDHGIYLDTRQEPPQNIQFLQDRLSKPRRSLSPSRFTDADYRAFTEANEGVVSEADVQRRILLSLLGSRKITSSGGTGFRNLAPLTDGTIVFCKPDYYEGSRPADLNRQIREELGEYIVPSSDTIRPCLPNFFIELKGPDGNMTVATRQACYDGAMGARAMLCLRAYIDRETALDRHAYTITSTFMSSCSSTLLTLYAVHPTTTPNNGSLRYMMTQIGTYALTNNRKSFVEGVTALRNAREWAMEKRKEMIRLANQVALASQLSDPSMNEVTAESSASLTSPRTRVLQGVRHKFWDLVGAVLGQP